MDLVDKFYNGELHPDDRTVHPAIINCFNYVLRGPVNHTL